MNCAWDQFLSIMPHGIRAEVDRLGKESLQEVHLRINRPVELIMKGFSHMLHTTATREDIQFVVNTASRYSPWAAATVSSGYITAPGGHRIGLCGDCVVQNGQVTAVRTATSLCIRVAREYQGIGQNAPKHGSLLILGPPGAGKTTLLRDLVRCRSVNGACVCVVDERGEIFPSGDVFVPGPRTDVLTGCSKAHGVLMALRTMGPHCIAVDEITAQEDCNALLQACGCGVELLATAHAANLNDLYMRPIYRPLVEMGIFEQVIILNRDKSWHMERMELCT